MSGCPPESNEYGFCPPLVPFSGVALSTGGLLFLAGVLVAFPPNTRAQDPPQSSDQKVEKEFYTPKERIEALRVALLFTPRAVGDADILQGPPQDPKQFQFHPNDKVICDASLMRWMGDLAQALEAATFQFPSAETGQKEIPAWSWVCRSGGIDLSKGRRRNASACRRPRHLGKVNQPMKSKCVPEKLLSHQLALRCVHCPPDIVPLFHCNTGKALPWSHAPVSAAAASLPHSN